MNRPISRRSVLAGAAAGTLLGSQGTAAKPLQTRVLGRTGLRATIVAMGCGESWWRYSKEEKAAREALEAALAAGIGYLDTGQTYGRGTSESWIGNTLGERRKGIVLATKISTRDGEEALRETERSLERLRTDRLDIVHIHNLRRDEDLAAIEKKGGVLEAVYKLRERKVARYIGITSHTDPVTLKTALERHDFDCVQMALNAAMQGYFADHSSKPGHSFESIALPVAKAKNLGILAMKVTGRDVLVGTEQTKAGARDLIRYVLSLPIAVAVVGMGNVSHIRDNAELAREFVPLSKQEMTSLANRVAPQQSALHRFFHGHEDA